MILSRNARRMGDALQRELERVDCKLVQTMLVGQDPVMMNVRYVILAKDNHPLHPDAPFRVFTASDWTLHPTQSNRDRGVILGTEAYWCDFQKAYRTARDIHGELLRNFTWVSPGTEDLVPGCLGSKVRA